MRQYPPIGIKRVDGSTLFGESESSKKERETIPDWIRYLDKGEMTAWGAELVDLHNQSGGVSKLVSDFDSLFASVVFSEKKIRPFQLPLKSEWDHQLIEDALSNCRILTDKKQLYFYYQATHWDVQTPRNIWHKAIALDANASLEVIHDLVEILWEHGLIQREPEYSHHDRRVY